MMDVSRSGTLVIKREKGDDVGVLLTSNTPTSSPFSLFNPLELGLIAPTMHGIL